MVSNNLLTIPNSLCLLRLVSAPVLLVLAWYGYRQEFIVVMVFAFLMDAVDGPIARWLHQVSELGPRLDTWADVAVYLSLPLGIWWLWPDLVRREGLYFGIIIVSVIVPGLAGFMKFRRPTSYHTWLVKFAAVVTAVSTFVLLMQGPALPFRLASFVCLAAAVEEIIITLILDRPRSDVRTLVHVIKSQRNG